MNSAPADADRPSNEQSDAFTKAQFDLITFSERMDSDKRVDAFLASLASLLGKAV